MENKPSPGSSTQVDSFRLVKRHSLWLLAAFFVTLAFFSTRNILEKLADQTRVRVVYRWAEVSANHSKLLHELQLERGLSSGYVASNGGAFADDLLRQRQLTDKALEVVVPTLFGDRNLDPYLEVAYPSALNDLRQIVSLRQMVNDLVVSRDATVDRYTAMIEMLFDVMSSSLVTDGGTLRPQLAFMAFLEAKEMAGQERALLTAILSSQDYGSFSRMAAFHRIRGIEELAVKRFRQFAEADAREGFERILAQPYVKEGDVIRRRVVAIGHSAIASPNSLPSAERWFQVSSQKIEAMKALESVVSGSVRSSAHDLRQRTDAGLVTSALSALASFLLGGILLTKFWRGRKAAEKDLYLAATVFSNSVESIVITDQQSTIVDVNRSFTRTTGYEREEVLGRHARLLKSGQHEKSFYAAMWDDLLRTGSWEGEVWNRRKNGEVYPALLSMVAVNNIRGETTNYIAMIVDISNRKKVEGQLEQLRTFDSLTGLLSRDAWVSAMDQAIARVGASDRKLAVLEVGLDRFKLINDSLGHEIGDKVLIAASERIKTILRRQDLAARPGGDRFSILLDDIAATQHAGVVCEKLLAAFVQPVSVAGHELHVSISIGVALYPADGKDGGALQKNAEAAMYRVKDEGRASARFYSEDMNNGSAQLLTMERALSRALERKEFTLHYQPQVDARSGLLIGVEALLR